MSVNQDFCFLTMEEFSRLGRREKSAYLEQAAEKVKEMHGEKSGLSLFKDAPLPPFVPEPSPKGS